MISARSAIAYGAAFLHAAGVSTATLDSRLLLQKLLHLELAQLLPLEAIALDFSLFDQLLTRRAAGEPIAYITGKKEFYGLNFIVTPATLIPRSDSEILVDAVLTNVSASSKITILDLGTGSSCLIISLLHHLVNARGIGVDISSAALQVAKENSFLLGVEGRLELRCGDLFAPLGAEKFDVIIANPPYISLEQRQYMSLETKYEPANALFAEENGLKFYRLIAANATNFLAPAACIYVEIGFDQRVSVETIFTQAGFTLHNVYYDLQNIARCFMFKLL
jgi:release factor glutamine methyltransferase